MSSLLYVGIDVDDKSFNVGLYSSNGIDLPQNNFKCQPTISALSGKLKKLEDQGYVLKTCHEASYLGFSLHRSLQARGIESTVIAPSLIPKAPAKRVKTDRLDCLELAKNYA